VDTDDLTWMDLKVGDMLVDDQNGDVSYFWLVIRVTSRCVTILKASNMVQEEIMRDKSSLKTCTWHTIWRRP